MMNRMMRFQTKQFGTIGLSVVIIVFVVLAVTFNAAASMLMGSPDTPSTVSGTKLIVRGSYVYASTITGGPDIGIYIINISNSQIISGEGISSDEQITDPGKSASTIIIKTGEIRTPYKISIQVTVIPQAAGGLYGQTVDRGTFPEVNYQTEYSSLFAKYKKRISSNLIIECYGKDDWIPTVDTVVGNNSGE